MAMRPLAPTAILMITLAALAGAASPAAAQGWIEPRPGHQGVGVIKLRTSVMVRVTDRIATIEVEEWFRNDGHERFGEGDYLYPLPGEAVFGNFSLFQGDQELRGETMDAEKARAIYLEIVRRKKDPALIELVGHGMIRARVFPITPGETRKITLRYTQVLERAGDAMQFRYAAGGAYIGQATPIRHDPPAIRPGRDPERDRAVRDQALQRDRDSLPPLTFTLVAEEGNRYRGAFSPTHEVRVTRDRGRMEVRPANDLRGDFALFLPFAERPVGLSLVTHRPSGEDGFFMLTLSPGEASLSRVPRDITAVVDVSGSMSGEKMEQARGALRQLLGTLDRGDRFRLIRFSSSVSTYERAWTVATPANVSHALAWIDELRAEGGTNISGALEEAFRAVSPETRLPVIVFVTDGLPSAGETDPEAIAKLAEAAAGRARVFAFGVGYDVNTYLLDRLGSAGRGGAQYVKPGENMEMALGTLATKIRHPVLADLEIGDSPVHIEDVYPRRLPDLFAGQDLVIVGRYRAGSRDVRGELRIEGRREGRAERYALDVSFPDHETRNDYLPRLWASRKIGVLQQEIRLNGGNAELVEEIRATALRYGLLSEYTSYLVLEPQMADVAAGARLRLDEVVVTGAASPPPMPGQSTGQVAVRNAELSRQSRDAKSIAEVEAAQNAAEDVMGRDADRATIRQLAGRMFVERDGEWKDVSLRDDARTVTIEAFGDAYFELLRRMPELEAYWKEFDAVTVMGRDVAIRVANVGATRMSGAELDRLVREFRGI
jgi:Ca-activated chloride channel family protein